MMITTTAQPAIAGAVQTAVTVRMYNVGFGDCLLVTFRHEGNTRTLLIDCGVHHKDEKGKARLPEVVQSIITETNGKLDAIAITHEHTDHLFGVTDIANQIRQNNLQISELWLAWTEDPDDQRAKELLEERRAKEHAGAAAAACLTKAKDPIAEHVEGLAALHTPDPDLPVSNAEKLQYLRDHTATQRYLHPADVIAWEEFPDVRIYVLGPPTDATFLRKMTNKRNQYFGIGPLDAELAVHAATLVRLPEAPQVDKDAFERSQPFDASWRIAEGAAAQNTDYGAFFKDHYLESGQPWRSIATDWLGVAESLALQLDSWTNNTSLVLAIELTRAGGERQVLLFVGDAQHGNWTSWQTLSLADAAGAKVTADDLLGLTVFYKVGHHGSENATMREHGLEQMPDGLSAVIPVDSEWALNTMGWRHPAENVLKRLQEKTDGQVWCSDKLPDVPADGKWVDITFDSGGAGPPAERLLPAASGLSLVHPEGMSVAQHRIDSHCHLFNGAYAFREALNIGWDYLRGTYPSADAHQKREALAALAATDRWKNKVKYLVSLFNVITDSCRDNYLTQIGAYQKSTMAQEKLICMPLMMDIYFMFASPDIDYGPAMIPGDSEIDDFKQFAARFVEEVITEAKHGTTFAAAAAPAAREAQLQAFEQQMKAIVSGCETELRGQSGNMLALTPRPHIEYAGMPVSWGYQTHLQELLFLQQEFAGQVFPFIAVDPRRPHVLDFLQRGTYNGKPLLSRSGPFFGVKVYPPLGYKPDHKELMKIYAWCAQAGLPVTAHCQPESFYNAICGTLKDKYGVFFADPINWIPVLKEYSDLRLNLAHFGGDDQIIAYDGKPLSEKPKAGDWTKTIIRLIEQYDHVYTDIAAGTSAAIPGKIGNIITDHAKVADRLMFGTDYVICMLGSGLGGALDAYYSQYADLGDAMLYDNAARFLDVATVPVPV